MAEIQTTTAKTFLEVCVTCPYCGAYDDIIDDAREVFDYGEISASSCDLEVTCSECDQIYHVNRIDY